MWGGHSCPPPLTLILAFRRVFRHGISRPGFSPSFKLLRQAAPVFSHKTNFRLTADTLTHSWLTPASRAYRILCAASHKPNMTRFRLSALTLLFSSLAFTQTISPRARAIHDSAIIVDTHADTPQRFLYENFDIGNSDPKTSGTSASTRLAPATWALNSFLSGPTPKQPAGTSPNQLST